MKQHILQWSVMALCCLLPAAVLTAQTINYTGIGNNTNGNKAVTSQFSAPYGNYTFTIPDKAGSNLSGLKSWLDNFQYYDDITWTATGGTLQNGAAVPTAGIKFTPTNSGADLSPDLNFVSWSDTCSSKTITITAKVKYHTTAPTQELTKVFTKTINLRAIPDGAISGATSIQQCVTATQTYSIASAFVSANAANSYVWTAPIGWSAATCTAATPCQTITTTPNSAGGGVVKCVMKINDNDLLPAIVTKTVTLNVNRFAPVLVSNFIPKVRYCPNEQVTISTNALSGVTNYTWSVPATYQIVSGQGTANAVIKVGTATGTVSCTATFCAGLTSTYITTTSLYQPITTVPAFVNGTQQDYTDYHCGSYRFCPTGGDVIIFEKPDYQTYTWSATGSWLYLGASSPVANMGGFKQSSATAALGTATVTVRNCVDNIGKSNTTTIEREPATYWCTVGPYPAWCPCCTPPAPGQIRGQQRLAHSTKSNDETDIQNIDITEFTVFPNPSTGEFIVNIPEQNPKATLNLYDINGKLVAQTTVFTQQTPVDMQAQPNGVYMLSIETETQTIFKKIILNR